jgi:hypothetical protein
MAVNFHPNHGHSHRNACSPRRVRTAWRQLCYNIFGKTQIPQSASCLKGTCSPKYVFTIHKQSKCVREPCLFLVCGPALASSSPSSPFAQHGTSENEARNTSGPSNTGGDEKNKISFATPKIALRPDTQMQHHSVSGPEHDGSINLAIRGLQNDGIIQTNTLSLKVSPNITLTQLNHLIVNKGM